MSHHITANYAMPVVLNPVKKASTSTTGTSSTGTTTGSSTTSTSGTDAASIGTTFLSLLTQELQNQDPTAPMDSTAMVGQMISLNQLAELTSINQAVGGSTTSVTGAMQLASSNTQSAATTNPTKPTPIESTPNQLPFDPNTLMPVTSTMSTDPTRTAARVSSAN